MSQGRSHGRHSLENPLPRQGRLPRMALAAGTATAVAVGAGILLSGAKFPNEPVTASTSVSDAAQGVSDSPTDTSRVEERMQRLSRSVQRVVVPKVKRKLWTTAPLDVRVFPREKTPKVGLIGSTKRVGVTGKRQGDYAQIVFRGTARWVSAQYLSKTKIVDPADRPLSNAPCPDGSSIEASLQPAAVRVYRAACAAFPELTAYGGQDGHGEHVNGEAIDFMVPSSTVGENLKDFLYAHHSELDLFDIIWSQQIWTIERSGEGFRGMSDRGSATANHFDHVHVKVN